MKKILSIVAFLLLGMTLFAQVPSQVTELTFQVGYTVCVTKPGFIPFVATIRDTECIQNTTLTGNNCFVATDVSAGYDVTTAIPYGNVTISSGNTDIYGTNTVTLKNNVTVQPGATLKITMGNQ